MQSDLSLICEQLPVPPTGDLSTQAKAIMKGLTGEEVDFNLKSSTGALAGMWTRRTKGSFPFIKTPTVSDSIKATASELVLVTRAPSLDYYGKFPGLKVETISDDNWYVTENDRVPGGVTLTTVPKGSTISEPLYTTYDVGQTYTEIGTISFACEDKGSYSRQHVEVTVNPGLRIATGTNNAVMLPLIVHRDDGYYVVGESSFNNNVAYQGSSTISGVELVDAESLTITSTNVTRRINNLLSVPLSTAHPIFMGDLSTWTLTPQPGSGSFRAFGMLVLRMSYSSSSGACSVLLSWINNSATSTSPNAILIS